MKKNLLPLFVTVISSMTVTANLIPDPGFETGSSTFLWGGSTVVNNNQNSGTYAARLDDTTQWGGGYEATITGLQSNTTYRFSAYVKSSGGEGQIGAKNFGGVQVSTSFENTEYQYKSITFTTGSSNTSATVFIWNPTSDAQYLYVDDLELVADSDEYELIFADEFNGTGSFDTSVWVPERGFQRNNEEQYYLPDNIEQRNGNLVITAKRETVANEYYDPNSSDWRYNTQYAYWTSGSIATFGNFNFLYGRVECRAKVTNLLGTWPAIWTVGDGIEWPAGGEIDIMENYKNKILANYAVAGSGQWNANWDSYSISVDDLGSNWENSYHIWTMDWSPERIAIYVDGLLLNEFDPSKTNSGSSHAYPGIAPFQTFPQVLWLNLAIGGNSGGNSSGLPNETEYLVDYIRVYQKTSDANILIDSGFESGSSSYLWGGSNVVSNNQYSGTFAAELVDTTQWGGGYEAVISGLSPNTTYLFSAWVKTSGGEGRVGVKNYGSSEDSLSFTNTNYEQKSIQFTTGSSNTSATIYIYNPTGGAQFIYADDLSLKQQ